MTESDNHIDKLFREKLIGREVTPDAAGWAQMELLLDKKDGNKWRFLFWLLPLFALLAGLWFYAGKNTQENGKEGTNVSVLEEKKSPVPNEEKTQATEKVYGVKDNTADTARIDSSALTNPIERNTTAITRPGIKNAETKISNDQTAGKNYIREIASRVSEPNTHRDNQELIQKEKHEFSSSGDQPGDGNITGTKPPTDVQATASGTDVIAASTQLIALPPVAEVRPEDSGNTENGEQGSGVTNETEIKSSPRKMNTLDGRFDISLPGYMPYQHDSGMNKTVDPPINLWSIEVAPYVGFSRSHFSGNDAQHDYLQRRNSEERSRFSTGIDISVSRDFSRFQFGAGVQYFRTGEQINYSPESIHTVTSYDTTMQYFAVVQTFYDTTYEQGQMIIDSTVVVTQDSTAIFSQLSALKKGNDPSIAAKNGPTLIQHITIPFRWGYMIGNVFGGKIYVNGSFDLTYVTASNAQYLSPDQSELLRVNQFGSYRNLMVQGSIGIAYRYPLKSGRGYVLVHPMVRTNLASWNTEFTQRNTQYGLRFGAGFYIR